MNSNPAAKSAWGPPRNTLDPRPGSSGTAAPAGLEGPHVVPSRCPPGAERILLEVSSSSCAWWFIRENPRGRRGVTRVPLWRCSPFWKLLFCIITGKEKLPVFYCFFSQIYRIIAFICLFIFSNYNERYFLTVVFLEWQL